MKPLLANISIWRQRWGCWQRAWLDQAGAFGRALLKDMRRNQLRDEPARGLRLHGASLEWTLLTALADAPRSQQLKLAASPDELNDPDKLAALIRGQAPDLQGPLALGLASDQLLLRVVELPSTDPTEMAEMVKLQLDKFSPFPEERLAVSYEQLQTTAQGSRVLIAAAPKERIEFLGQLFAKAGLELRRIDLDALAWWRLLSEHGSASGAGRRAVLRLDQDGLLMIALQQGVPLAFKALGPGEQLAPEEFAAEIAHELEGLILALDLEQGPASLSGLDLWQDPQLMPPSLPERLEATSGLAPQLHDLAKLPPLSCGLAQRLLEPLFIDQPGPHAGVPARLDLIPASWRAAAAAARLKRRLLAATLLLLALWLLAGAVLLSGASWEKYTLHRLQKRAGQLQPPAEAVRAMQRQARLFEQYLDRRQSALECLREISQLLPADVCLTSFQFKKGTIVSLRGEALSVNPIYDFKQALDKSSLFGKVELGSTQPTKRKTTSLQTFQMTLHLPEGAP